MSNKSMFGAASSSIVSAFTAAETLMTAVNTTALALNNLADVALVTSEGYKQSAILRSKIELAELEKEVNKLPKPKKEKKGK